MICEIVAVFFIIRDGGVFRGTGEFSRSVAASVILESVGDEGALSPRASTGHPNRRDTQNKSAKTHVTKTKYSCLRNLQIALSTC